MNKKIRAALFCAVFLLLVLNPVFSQEENAGERAFSLDDCISQALKSHPQLSIYEHKTGQQEENLRSVAAERLPQIDAAARYDRLSYVPQSKQRYLGGSDDDYQADIFVTQSLYTGGRLTAQRKSAQYAVEAARQGYRAAREEVIFGVKAAYFRLLFTHELVKSKEVLLKYAESSYNTAVELNQRTKIPREETLLRLSVQLNDVRQELIGARENLTIAQKALRNAMGFDSNGPIEVQDIGNDFIVSIDEKTGIADNPEIARIGEEIKQAEASIKVAKSNFYPQLSARYGYGYEWARPGEGKTDWAAGIAVDLNIWDWGKTRADVRREKEHKAELKAYEELLNRQIWLELESARLKYESAGSRAGIAKTNCEQAQKSLNLFEGRYLDALVTSVEILDAQRAFSEAQVNCALSKLDKRLAAAEIEKITGKGHDLK